MPYTVSLHSLQISLAPAGQRLDGIRPPGYHGCNVSQMVVDFRVGAGATDDLQGNTRSVSPGQNFTGLVAGAAGDCIKSKKAPLSLRDIQASIMRGPELWTRPHSCQSMTFLMGTGWPQPSLHLSSLILSPRLVLAAIWDGTHLDLTPLGTPPSWPANTNL